VSATTEDRVLLCADCGGSFVWSAEDQEFHRLQGYKPPRRCKDCRRAKREQEAGEEKGGKK
jgi:hypothetical protein